MKTHITQSVVDALKPRARDVFVWDTALTGFGVKVTPAGKRVYVFQYRQGGRAAPTKRITIGRDGDWSAARARSHATELARLVETGAAPSDGAAPRREARTNGAARTSGETWQIRLGFIIADIARLQTTLLRQTMKSLGGSYAQWSMLGQLALHQGVTQMELAKLLDLTKVAVTGLVDRAVRAGWVERRLDTNDRRVRRLYLTPRARAAVALMREKVDLMTAQSMSQISDPEGRALVAALDEIKSHLLLLGRRGRRVKKSRDTGTSPRP